MESATLIFSVSCLTKGYIENHFMTASEMIEYVRKTLSENFSNEDEVLSKLTAILVAVRNKKAYIQPLPKYDNGVMTVCLAELTTLERARHILLSQELSIEKRLN